MELRGSRVSIRPVGWDDLPTICKWWNNPIVMREVRAERLRPSLEQIQADSWPVWRDPDPTQFHMFVICLGGRVIGEVGYRFEDVARGKASLDIKIGEPALWGHGLGTEATKLLVSYLFDEMKAEQIIAQPGEWNARGRRMFGKCGLTEVSREWVPPNEFFDGGVAVTVSLDREEHGRKKIPWRRPIESPGLVWSRQRRTIEHP